MMQEEILKHHCKSDCIQYVYGKGCAMQDRCPTAKVFNENKRLQEALEQQVTTYETLKKYNDKGDAYNMYLIAQQALKGDTDESVGG